MKIIYRPFVVGLLLTAALAFSTQKSRASEVDDDNLTEEVLGCEEAVGKLESCCPSGTTTRMTCQHYFSSDSGCNSTSTTWEDPVLPLNESRCVMAKSCQTLVADGTCERARDAVARAGSSHEENGYASEYAKTTTNGTVHTPVCY